MPLLPVDRVVETLLTLSGSPVHTISVECYEEDALEMCYALKVFLTVRLQQPGTVGLSREDLVEGEGGLEGVESRWLESVSKSERRMYLCAKGTLILNQVCNVVVNIQLNRRVSQITSFNTHQTLKPRSRRGAWHQVLEHSPPLLRTVRNVVAFSLPLVTLGHPVDINRSWIVSFPQTLHLQDAARHTDHADRSALLLQRETLHRPRSATRR